MKRIVIVLISIFSASFSFSQTPRLENSSSETTSSKKAELNKVEPKLMVSERKETTEKNNSSVPKISAIEKKEERIEEESSNPK